MVSRQVDANQTDAPGERLVQELLWVHSLIRRDLDTVRVLAQRVASGADPQEVREEIAGLQTNSPLWKLRVNCLYYCRFVHSHHNAEDWLLFPALRRSSPAMEPVVDKLEADHREVSGHLDEIEAACDALVRDDTAAARDRAVGSLNVLAELLLVHLAYEEEAVAPTLRSWKYWPAH
jgi:iron-sulfur cluster repair protein YtfE (RIC family)